MNTSRIAASIATAAAPTSAQPQPVAPSIWAVTGGDVRGDARGDAMHARRRLTTVALNVLVVALLAVAGWLAYTGWTATTTVPTYNNQPGQVPERVTPNQPQQDTTKETPRYV